MATGNQVANENQASDVELLQSRSEEDSQDNRDIDSSQYKDKLNTHDRDKSDQGPIERQLDATPRSNKGPLATIAERVAENPTVQRAAYHIPNSARPILGTITEPVSRVAGAVDSTLTTEEGHRLTSTANEFFFAIAGFTLMILTLAVTKLESTFKVVPEQDVREVTDSMANSGDGFNRGIFGEDIPRNQLYMKKARALFSRYVTLVHGATGLRKNPESRSHSRTTSTSDVTSSVTNEASHDTNRNTSNDELNDENFSKERETNGNSESFQDRVQKMEEKLVADYNLNKQ